MNTIREKDYRMVKLTDGTTIMGSIVVDKDFLRITNALELNTVKRETDFGMKDDSTLAPWLPFTNDKTFVIPRDKILVITQADEHISHYYEVILNKVEKAKENATEKKVERWELERRLSISNAYFAGVSRTEQCYPRRIAFGEAALHHDF